MTFIIAKIQQVQVSTQMSSTLIFVNSWTSSYSNSVRITVQKDNRDCELISAQPTLAVYMYTSRGFDSHYR